MTQKTNVLNHLKNGRSITQIDALNLFGCFRLAAIIHKLRNEGYDIRTRHIANGKKVFASYYMKLN